MPTTIRSVPPLVTEAINVASAVHAGQLDRQGTPYIGHPARVAAHFSDDVDATIVGWLHDVLEKSSTTAPDLAQTFPPHIVAAVVAISREPGETLASYCARTRSDELAKRVKFADVMDNSDPRRMALLAPAVQAQLTEQYRHTQALLTQSAATVPGESAFQHGAQPISTYRVAG